ncbi:MAG: DinB family protein [Gemmatimonadaceae bacterium]|nr:DinB family protein [Gemmatimonadaceae bacterium]MCW5825992.1 DinB family protein [Gemmatimonadaceae bacterium]
MSTSPSQQQLDEIAKASAEVARRFTALDARVSDAQWNARPAPDEWSVAECVAHLNLSSAAMLPRMRAAIAEAKALGPIGTRAYKGALFGRVLAAMMGPVPVVLGFRLGRTKTPKPFVPGSELPREGVVADFRKWIGEEQALLWTAADLQIDRVTLESPFVAGARYDAYSALWIVVRHELRHLVQAERALARVEATR